MMNHPLSLIVTMRRSLGRWLPQEATAALSSTSASTSIYENRQAVYENAAVASVPALPASVVEAPADKTANRKPDAEADGGLFGTDLTLASTQSPK